MGIPVIVTVERQALKARINYALVNPRHQAGIALSALLIFWTKKTWGVAPGCDEYAPLALDTYRRAPPPIQPLFRYMQACFRHGFLL